MQNEKSKLKRLFSGFLIVVLLFCVVAFGIKLSENTTQNNAGEQIVDLTKSNGHLTASQINFLNNGASIQYSNEIYRLSRAGDEKIYEYTDSENVLTRKFIRISGKTYTQWTETNDEYVSKELLASYLEAYVKNRDLNAALSDYATDSALNEALKDYVQNGEMNKALNAALANYIQSNEIQKLLTNTLASYVKNSDGKGIINRYTLSTDKVLSFEQNAMYIVQCCDTSGNLTDFFFVDGNKTGKNGRFAMVFVGDHIYDSLVVYQTDSILVSNLAGTSFGASGLKPASGAYLTYFKLGGKVI